MTDLKSELVSRARALGFDICRVAPCAAPPHAAEFGRWLTEGSAGEMAWLERNKERRMDPDRVLPGARYLIVLAMNYWQGGEDSNHGSRRGTFARYAWGDDYHDLIEGRLGNWTAGWGCRVGPNGATSTPARFSNATLGLWPASDGTGKARCSSHRSWEPGSFLRRF